MTDTVYSTLAEKISAYTEFFKSDDIHLIVIGVGPGGDGVGKTLALQRVEQNDPYILIIPGETQNIIYNKHIRKHVRIIYHLFKGQEVLADNLAKEYGARILRFARGTEL